MKLIIIAAVSIDGVIGIDDNIPWKIPEDFKHFRNTTMNHMLLVGYNTYLTLPEKAFYGREYLVLNGGNTFNNNKPNVYQFSDFETINKLLKNSTNKLNTVFVAGGASVYNYLIDRCDEAIITWVNKTYPDGDKKFPIDKLFNNFEITSDQAWQKSTCDLLYKITSYKRS